jgi:hypothetical protein
MMNATALRALGILGGERLVLLMNRIREGDAALEEDLFQMERATNALAMAAPPAQPPADLKRRVLSRVAIDGYYFLHERESEWEPTPYAGAYVRQLFIDTRGRTETRLVRLSAGTPPVALAELAGADFYLISGDLHVDGASLEFGDYFHAGASALTGKSGQGCVLFTVLTAGSRSPRGTSRSRVTVRPLEGEWVEESGPGVTTKLLGSDPDRGIEMRLVRMEPGARWKSHRRDSPEEVFVIRGSWRCLGTNLHPGDFHRAGVGIEHETSSSVPGCKLIVVRHLQA